MSDSSNVGAGLAIALIVYLLILGGMIAFGVWLYTAIAKKAGYNRWMGLLAFIPLVNFIVIIMFAVQQWPVERELDAYRAQAGVPPVSQLPVDQTPLPGFLAGYGQGAPAGQAPRPWDPGPGAGGTAQFPPPPQQNPGQYPTDSSR